MEGLLSDWYSRLYIIRLVGLVVTICIAHYEGRLIIDGVTKLYS